MIEDEYSVKPSRLSVPQKRKKKFVKNPAAASLSNGEHKPKVISRRDKLFDKHKGIDWENYDDY